MEYQQLEQSAMRMLAACEHSHFMLRQKLLKRSDNEADVARLLERLGTDGLLSDERFTEVFVNSHRNKGKGPSRILKELQQHQISSDLISIHLDVDDASWLETAAEVRRKKFGQQTPGDYKEKMRQARFLEYRGFTHSQIFSVLD